MGKELRVSRRAKRPQRKFTKSVGWGELGGRVGCKHPRLTCSVSSARLAWSPRA